MMLESGKLTLEAELIPSGIALRPEERCALVVVNAMNFIIPAKYVHTSLPISPDDPVTNTISMRSFVFQFSECHSPLMRCDY
jgi:hypothetical protein